MRVPTVPGEAERHFAVVTLYDEAKKSVGADMFCGLIQFPMCDNDGRLNYGDNVLAILTLARSTPGAKVSVIFPRGLNPAPS